ncbi:hypothetical protein HYS48_03105 [Candidatus Woesearchaeota archaeon]|nr:hypothetical protein [Candidatus Woesearchaeota archaeon]
MSKKDNVTETHLDVQHAVRRVRSIALDTKLEEMRLERTLEGEPAVLIPEDLKLGGWHAKIVQRGGRDVEEELPEHEFLLEGRRVRVRILYFKPGEKHVLGYDPRPKEGIEKDPNQVCVQVWKSEPNRAGKLVYDKRKPSSAVLSFVRMKRGNLEAVVAAHGHYKQGTTRIESEGGEGRRASAFFTVIEDRTGKRIKEMTIGSKQVLLPDMVLYFAYELEGVDEPKKYLDAWNQRLIYTEGLVDAQGKPLPMEQVQLQRVLRELGTRDIYFLLNHTKAGKIQVYGPEDGVEPAMVKEDIPYINNGQTVKVPGLKVHPETAARRIATQGIYGIVIGSDLEVTREIAQKDYRGAADVLLLPTADPLHAYVGIAQNGTVTVLPLSSGNIQYKTEGDTRRVQGNEPVLLPEECIVLFGTNLDFRMRFFNKKK